MFSGAKDGETLTNVAEEVALLREAMLRSSHPPDRLVVFVLSGDFRRKVADVIRDYGDGEPPVVNRPTRPTTR